MRVIIAFDLLGEHRHKGHVEGAFGEEPAEKVGERESDQESLGNGASAQCRSNQDVAYKAQQPAEHCPNTHGEEARHEADRLHEVARSNPCVMASRSFFSNALRLASE